MTVGSVGKRKAERRDCQVKAQVLLPDAEAADAVILNFSATGARARLAAPLDLPARFKLFIPSRPETKSVLLRWRNGRPLNPPGWSRLPSTNPSRLRVVLVAMMPLIWLS